MSGAARAFLASVLVLALCAALGPAAARANCREARSDELGFLPSGELLFARCGSGERSAVLRLDQTGRLDPSFARDGSLGPWPQMSQPHLAVTPDGKLLLQTRLAGNLGRASGRMVLRRFSADGSLDRSFGDGGSVVVPTHKERSEPAGLIRVFSQPGGDSVVAYYGSDSGCFGGFCAERTYFLRLFRYSPTGKLIDTAWYYTEYWDLRGLAMAPDGGFVVTGSATEYSIDTYLRTWPDLKSRVHRDFHEGRGPGVLVAGPGGSFWGGGGIGRAARYRLHGSRDRSFGDEGLTAACPSANSSFEALQRLPSGGLVAAGGGCGVAEYRADGSLDTRFGQGGVVDLLGLGLVPYRFRLESMVVGPRGQLALAFRGEYDYRTRIIRLTPSGALDRRFGDDGVLAFRGFGAPRTTG